MIKFPIMIRRQDSHSCLPCLTAGTAACYIRLSRRRAVATDGGLNHGTACSPQSRKRDDDWARHVDQDTRCISERRQEIMFKPRADCQANGRARIQVDRLRLRGNCPWPATRVPDQHPHWRPPPMPGFWMQTDEGSCLARTWNLVSEDSTLSAAAPRD